VALMRHVLEAYRRSLGGEHPNVAASATSLAYWLIDLREYAEAAGLVEESLAILGKSLGNEHPQVASTLTVKADLMLATGKYEAARDVATEAQRILLGSLPEDHWQVAAARNAAGAALAGLGDFEAAERLLLGSLAGLAGSPIPDLEARGRQRVYQLYRAWGRPEQAARYRS
jgi:tetratricopeptide (TPR) repeat protein